MNDRGNCVQLRLRGNLRDPANLTRHCNIGLDPSKCESCPSFEGYRPHKFAPAIEARLEQLREERKSAALATVPNGDIDAYAKAVARNAYRPLWMRLRQFAARARSFIRAVASWIFGRRISRKRYEMRISACLGCEHRQAATPVGYCGACGCGRNPLSELSIKAKMPAAQCPTGKWPR